MANQIAVVRDISGKFYAKEPDGSLRELSEGDKIYEGEIVVGANGNSDLDSLILTMNDGTDLVVLGNEKQLFDSSLSNVEFSSDETVTDTHSLQDLISDSNNPNNVNDDADAMQTAAGVAATDSSDGDLASNFKTIDVAVDNNTNNSITDTVIRDTAIPTVETVVDHTVETPLDINRESLLDTLSQIKNNVSDLTNAANDAAKTATDAATAADNAAAKADDMPTEENLTAAQDAEDVATAAATTAANAANALDAAINTLKVAADAANESVDTTDNVKVVDDTRQTVQTTMESGATNDRISEVTDSDTTVNAVDENVADGTYTGVTLNAVDVDGDAVPFRVEDDGRVVVDGDNAIDFENKESYTFDVTATSADGTSSTQSVTVNVNDIDDTAGTIAINTISDDDVVNAAESDDTLTVNGTTTGIEEGQSVTLTLNDKTYSADVDANGNWSVDVPSADVKDLNDATAYQVDADVSDAAGNASETATHIINVDELSEATLAIHDDDGSDNNNVIEEDEASSVLIDGTLESGGTITALSVTDGTNTINVSSDDITVNDDGTWSTIQDLSSLDDGTLTVDMSTKDAAGNEGSEQTTIDKDTSGSNTGSVQDSAIAGCEFNTSSGVHGVTDADGNFTYNDGDTVTFSIGGVTIGSASADAIHNFDDGDGNFMFLQDLAGVELDNFDNEQVENMAMFLQSLDSDGDASNGIQVSDEAREALADTHLDLSSADVRESDVAHVLDSLVDSGVEGVHSFNADNAAQVESDMMNHVQDTVLDIVSDATNESSGESSGIDFMDPLDAMSDKLKDMMSLKDELSGGELHTEDTTDAHGVDLGSVSEDASITFSAQDLLANSTAVHGARDGSDLTVSNVNVDPKYGTLTENDDGTYTFTPAETTVDVNNLPIHYTVNDWSASEDITATLDISNVITAEEEASDADVASKLATENTESEIIVNETGTDGALVLDSTGSNPELLGGATSVDITISLTGEANQGQASILSYDSSEQDNEFLIFSDGNNVKLYLNGANVNTGITSDELFDGTQHKFNVSWDSQTGKAEFFLDGNLEGIQTIAKGHTIDSNGVLMLGQEQDHVGGGLDSNQIFSGEFQDVSVSVDGEKVAHWDMNGISSDGTVSDSVGNFDLAVTGDTTIGGTNISTDEDSPVIIDVLANDTDADGDKLAITKIDGQDVSDGQTASITDENGNTLGTAILTDDGKVEFTPSKELQEMNDGEHKDVTFDYTVSDGKGGEATANVTVDVTGTNEQIVGTSGNDHLVGTADNDTITGGEGRNFIDAGAGDDTVNITEGDGRASYEIVRGGAGDDTVVFEGNRNDYTVSHEDANGRFRVENIDTQENQYIYDDVENIKFADQIVETHDDQGNVNADFVNDVVIGSAERDVIYTGSGDDVINSGTGNDHISAGSGNDIITGGEGRNFIDAGAGDDTVNITEGDGRASYEIVRGGEGDDTVVFEGNRDDYTVSHEDANGRFRVENIDTQENQYIYDDVENIKFADKTVATHDAQGNIISDLQAPDITKLAITDIIDASGDYSSVTMQGTGAEVGNTIILYDEDNNAVASTTVGDDGIWSVDISNLENTAVNDNEFFNVTETDAAGNVTAHTDSTQYWHGTPSSGSTEATDDFVLMGEGDDTANIEANDANNHLFVDGGLGNDTAKLSGNIADYSIVKEDGNIVVTDISDGVKNGDVVEFKDVETITFADGKYDVGSDTLNSYATAENDSVITNEDSDYTFTTDDFGYSDTDGDALHSVTITDIPDSGSLTLNGTAVSDGDVISASDITDGKLVFTPAENSDTNVNINFKVSDNGTDWSNEAQTTINVDAVADTPTVTVDLGEMVISESNTGIEMNASDVHFYEDGNGGDADLSDNNNQVVFGNDWEQIKLNDGDDTAIVGNAADDSQFDAGDGNNKIILGDNWKDVKLGDGNNSILAGDGSNDGESKFDAGGDGNNNIILGDNWNEIKGGDGNDIINVGNASSDKALIDTGDGDNVVTVGAGWQEIKGGEGNDTVIFKGTSDDFTVDDKGDGKIEVTNNATNAVTKLEDIENIAFGGENVNSSVHYSYNLNIDTALSDTDGSESLTISVDMPDSTTLTNSLGDNITVADGQAVLTSAQLDGLKLVSDTPLSASDDISLTATATDGSSSASTTIVYDMGETINMSDSDQESATGTDANDTIYMGTGQQQQAEGGAGDDTIDVAGSDFKAYGEAGSDTFKIDSNDFKDGDFNGNDSLIDGGEGLDGLVISNDMDLNFDALKDNIDNIESINLDDGAQNITSLSVDDVLDMTGDDNIIRIDGDKFDSISLDTDTDGSGEWKLGDFKTDAETGQEYQEVTGVADDGSSVTLEISTDIHVDES
ncbi:cadherin-like domain-containing protein [Sulfurimonas sp.]|uniref:cadherin-like domain-containing protein n=1 Tax=Sulfurimonas sp. TaxID=2022749 RepID=UPI002625B941|nr:cadherin-like domain-containing protein [Sulfurimonas sp.]